MKKSFISLLLSEVMAEEAAIIFEYIIIEYNEGRAKRFGESRISFWEKCNTATGLEDRRLELCGKQHPRLPK